MEDLFEPIVPVEKRHRAFTMMQGAQYGPERAVLQEWGADFVDRDGKFVAQFQSTFESSMWELYLNACLRALGIERNFTFDRPDFVAQKAGERFCVEATIAAPALGGMPPIGDLRDAIPTDFNRFNSEAAVRLANSFSSKVKKYRESYAALPQCAAAPYVIAIASFDRPYSHFAASRPILSALYGLYYDEDATAPDAKNVVSYNVKGVRKNETTDIDLGFFTTGEYSDVSAVIYSSLATWGKVRAMADNHEAQSVYVTFHPREGSIRPTMRVTPKAQYTEDLLDGLYVFHNPSAARPLSRELFAHPRIAQFFVKPDGELEIIAPDDMLLVRFLWTVNTEEQAGALAKAFGLDPKDVPRPKD